MVTTATARKILHPEALPPLLDEQRSEGRKIVFTNGCFDILHAGHVDYLERAGRISNRFADQFRKRDAWTVGRDVDLFAV